MEFDFATIGPTIFYGILSFCILYILARGRLMFRRTIHWLVINGYYFPSVMRPLRDNNIARIEKENAETQKIIDDRSI